MEDTAAAASGEAEESSLESTAPSPSSSSAPPAPTETSPPPAPYDPLAKALQTLFLNVTTLVQGELQVCSRERTLAPSISAVMSKHQRIEDFYFLKF
jgi:hypothetical protein